MIETHQPVLLEAALNGLNIMPNGIYIDGTFGRGGHARAILESLGPLGRLLVFDKDEKAIAYAHQIFKNDDRVTIIHDTFANINTICNSMAIQKQVSGILLDLGVSSPQLDIAERGFSFMREGPLDMRMNQTQAFDAEQFINDTPEDDMAVIFKTYGEERYARRIAAAINRKRSTLGPIKSTTELAHIVKEAHPAWEKHKHPATRVFQAIRIYVNQELDDLTQGLEASVSVLAQGGRLAVISFHSLEDRMVKRFMLAKEEGVRPPKSLPVRYDTYQTEFKRVGKAIKPGLEEMEDNIRARSAVLRIGEKTS